jgi:hypothetical protein
MVTEQQTPNKRVASSPAAKSTANVISKKRITGEAPYPFRISGVSSQNDKNGKGENAERSEPNIGQIPGRAGPRHPPTGGLALVVSTIYLYGASE